MTHRLLGLILAVGVCAVGCREQGSGTPATERKGGPEVARVEARDADENPRKENGARRDGGEREVAVIPVAEERRSNPEGFLRIDWELETSGRNLYLPEDRKNRRYLIARGWDDDLRVEQVADFTRFVRIRNEGEALRYVRLLDGLQGLLPGLDCFDPVKTPGELLTDRLHPQPTQREGRAESDLKLYRLPK
ncbi:MAG TPA: hypothetical protein VK447_00735, partial [Myxococcaceae bacterium]|nr:hypothetical protein [Myxococcaceae bacterium]